MKALVTITTRSLTLAGLALALSACGGDASPGGAMSGSVLIDGSSTVFPIAEAVAEEFQAANPDIRVTVGFSGSGGGFGKMRERSLLAGASTPE